MPLRQSRYRPKRHEFTHKFQGRMKVTKQVRQLHIYVPAIVPAKLPGETTAHFRIECSSSNTKCNHVYSRSLFPLCTISVQLASSTVNYYSTQYNAMSYPINLDVSHMGPLNVLVTSLKDSSMDPPRSSDLCPHALSCMSSGALAPFGSEAAIYVNGLPSRGGAGPLGP